MKAIHLALCAACFAAPVTAHDYGFAGILSNGNSGDMPGLTLSAGEPIAEAPITLESGKVYELEITSDGSAELALTGPGFFRAIWVNEVVINGLEVRPFGLESVEFDEAGEMEIEFVAIKPGIYELKVPGSTGDTQRVEITIK
ncbi:cupredoxin domain-containing protein [Roseivivax sp. CAU 1753]